MKHIGNKPEKNETDNQLEPVLLVPPKLTKSTYAILMHNDCVARPWHLDGQYGSRTHVVMVPSTNDKNDTPSNMVKKLGIPILRSSAHMFIDFQSSWKQQNIRIDSENITSDGEERLIDADNIEDRNSANFPFSEELKKILVTEGVEIIYRKIPIPKNKLSMFQSNDQNSEMKSHKPLHDPNNLGSLEKEFQCQIPHYGKYCDESGPKKQKKEPLFTFAELFCGIGGFGVALEALGGQCIFASEINQYCRQVFSHNIQLPTSSLYGDITQIPDDQLPSSSSLDLLVGGFPCQPFSTSGDQPGFSDENGRGLLYTQIVRFLKVCQPKAFLLENVPGLLGTDSGQAYEKIVSSLQSEAGYEVKVETISSRGLTAQSRKRVYFVGLKQYNQKDSRKKSNCSEFHFPLLPDLGIRADDVIHYHNDVHESYFLTDAQLKQLLENYHTKRKWKPAKLFVWPSSVCRTIDSHYGISVGKGNSQLVPCLAPRHPRRFTIRECARIMGFPNSYQFPQHSDNIVDGTTSSMNHKKRLYHMLGNAVCPPVIAAIAGSVLACCPDIPGYKEKTDWKSWGLNTAIGLSLSSVLPEKRELLLKSFLSQYPHSSSLDNEK